MTDGEELDAAIRRMWRALDAHGALGAFADYAASVPAAQHAALQAEYDAIARCRGDRVAPSPADGERRLLSGRYEIRGELARGGMAVVYRAFDVVLGRPVVLKTTPAGVLRNAHARRQLEREAKALGKIESRGICPILDVVEDAGAYHVVLPLIAGDTLAARIAAVRGERGPGERAAGGAAGDDPLGVGVAVGGRARSFPARRAQPGLGRLLEFVARAARAVHAAHEVGIVHRDLKPSNIMVKPDGEPVVLDFGLAIDEGSDSRRSTAAARDGTPAYMAPEQLDGAWDRIDRRTDVHALGVVLYEALTLEHPFAARNHAALVAKIMVGRHRSLRQVDRTLPADLEAVCAKAMHVAPAQRYASALEFAAELERVVQGEPTRARPARPWRRCAQWVRRNALTTVAFGVALAATSLAVGVWLQKQTAQQYPAAFVRVTQAIEGGRTPDAADLDLLGHLCPDPEELASFLRDPADPSLYERMLRRVVEFAATRGADGPGAGRLVQPRETIVESDPAFRFEVPDTGTATWSLVLTVWPDGLPAIVTEVREHRGPATTITVAVPRDRLPAGPTYHWTVRRAAEEDPDHPLFAPAPASFRFANAASRDAVLARAGGTGAPDLDVLLRANALLVAGFVADAGTELARLRADASRHERRLACCLGAEVALRLGDRQEFERMRRWACLPGESR